MGSRLFVFFALLVLGFAARYINSQTVACDPDSLFIIPWSDVGDWWGATDGGLADPVVLDPEDYDVLGLSVAPNNEQFECCVGNISPTEDAAIPKDEIFDALTLNWADACCNSGLCQDGTVTIASSTQIWVLGVNTVATT